MALTSNDRKPSNRRKNAWGDQLITANNSGLPSSNTLVCLATYNEGQTIGGLLEAILQLPISADVLVIDDSSTDRTHDCVLDLVEKCRHVALLQRPQKLGVGSAHRIGWLFARQLGYSRIVTLDADLSHDPADILRMLAVLDAGTDIVIGSRFMAGGRLDYKGWRLFMSKTANKLLSSSLRVPLTEFTTSFRAARLDRVPNGLVETIEQDGYSFFFVCIWRFFKAGLTVSEIPIHFRDRQKGVSKLPHIEILQAAFTFLRLLSLPNRLHGNGKVTRCPSCGAPAVLTISRRSCCLRCSYQVL